MTENNYGEPNFNTTPAPETPESNHPVLQQLKDKISSLEADVLKEQQLRRENFMAKSAYEERVKRVLVEAMEDYDVETIKHIAEQLDITLSVSKQIEVNVTFTIDLEYEVGEEPDAEWDFDFSVSHSDIVDYSSDVIYSKDV